MARGRCEDEDLISCDGDGSGNVEDVAAISVEDGSIGETNHEQQEIELMIPI